MSQTMLLAAGISALLLFASAALMLQLVTREDRVGQRLREANGTAPKRQPNGRHVEAPGKGIVAPVLRLLGQIGGSIATSGILSRKTLEQLEQTLSSSGMSRSNSLGLFIGAKVTLVIALPVLAQLALRGSSFSGSGALVLTLLAAVAGLMTPDLLIGRIRKKYLAGVEAGLPDTLDLLLICAQSGLSLQPAIIRVELEIRETYPGVAWELAQTANELQYIADSRVALTNLGNRTGLDSLRRLTATLIQTLQYGTPLSDALRSLSAEMRAATLTRFEEKAAKLPVLLTLPMIMFIMPCVFMVVGGPAVIQLIKTFG